MAKEGFATKKFPTSVSTILYLTYKTLAENIFKNFTKNSASYIDSLDSCFRNQNSSKVLFPSLTKSYYTVWPLLRVVARIYYKSDGRVYFVL